MLLNLLFAVLVVLFYGVIGEPFGPDNPYPIPIYEDQEDIIAALKSIARKLERPNYPPDLAVDNTTWSVAVTSKDSILWAHQKARKNIPREERPLHVTEKSQFRIASISKVFTVLALLKQAGAGKVSLDDPVIKYLPELAALGHNEKNTEPRPQWDRITLRMLASQSSGLQREALRTTPMWNLANTIDNATAVERGLPILPSSEIPSCDPDPKSQRPRVCSRHEFLEDVATNKPMYMPDYKPSYSNEAFAIIALALENATGTEFMTLTKSTVVEALELTDTYVGEKPPPENVVPGQLQWWDLDHGYYNATGGHYSSARDLSKLQRYILNDPLLANQWLKPATYNSGMFSAYGMPWEIFRSPRLLKSGRPVTLYTKSGGLVKYFSYIILVPEFGLGVTILTEGDDGVKTWLREVVMTTLIPAADKAASKATASKYGGLYEINKADGGSTTASMRLTVDANHGLHATSFFVNGSDVLCWLDVKSARPRSGKMEMFPTKVNLAGDGNGTQKREAWRARWVSKPKGPSSKVFDDFVVEDDDGEAYGTEPLAEVQFHVDASDRVLGVTLPSRQVYLAKRDEHAPSWSQSFGQTILGQFKSIWSDRTGDDL